MRNVTWLLALVGCTPDAPLEDRSTEPARGGHPADTVSGYACYGTGSLDVGTDGVVEDSLFVGSESRAPYRELLRVRSSVDYYGGPAITTTTTSWDEEEKLAEDTITVGYGVEDHFVVGFADGREVSQLWDFGNDGIVEYHDATSYDDDRILENVAVSFDGYSETVSRTTYVYRHDALVEVRFDQDDDGVAELTVAVTHPDPESERWTYPNGDTTLRREVYQGGELTFRSTEVDYVATAGVDLLEERTYDGGLVTDRSTWSPSGSQQQVWTYDPFGRGLTVVTSNEPASGDPSSDLEAWVWSCP